MAQYRRRMWFSSISTGLAAIALVVFALGYRVPADQAGGTEGTTLAVAGTINTSASIAASGSNVIVVWAAATPDRTDIFAAVSTDGGRTFAAPVRVNDVAGDARVTGEQPPRVCCGSMRG